MNPYVFLLVDSLISLAASLAVLHAQSLPPANVLDGVCPNEKAASFWSSYTKVMLMIAPLLLVLVVGMLPHFSDPIDALRFALVAALVGLLVGLHSVGKRLGRFVTVPQQQGSTS